MTGNVILMRPKVKGGTVTVLYRPDYFLVVHLTDDRTEDSGETELARVTESRAFAQITAQCFAKKFGALYIPEMFE